MDFIRVSANNECMHECLVLHKLPVGASLLFVDDIHISGRWIEKSKRLRVALRFLRSVPKNKLYYSLRVHHWTNAADVPNVRDVYVSNGNNKSQWRDIQRLKSRRSIYKQTLRDLDHNCYYVIEVGIFKKSKSLCFIRTSEVIFSGRQGMFVARLFVDSSYDELVMLNMYDEVLHYTVKELSL